MEIVVGEYESLIKQVLLGTDVGAIPDCDVASGTVQGAALD
jgi:hypothetical protein